jgi:Putative adhesin
MQADTPVSDFIFRQPGSLDMNTAAMRIGNAKTSTLALYGAFAVILLSTLYPGSAHADEYAKTYALTGRGEVHVDADNGAVRVSTWDSPKVAFDLHYDGGAWSDALKIDSRQIGNVVELIAVEREHSWWNWGHFGNRRLIVEVHMPKDADLRLGTSNGRVDVSTLNGKVTIHTSNGSINADHLAGNIHLASSNGAIVVDSLQGSVKVRTSNGSITATGVDGKCELVTSNGRIQADGRFEALDIVSSNGSVTARSESGSKMSGDWSIRTSNAMVDLSLPSDLKATLDAGTSNGRIALELPVTVQGYQSGNELHGMLNGGGPELHIRTSNAQIRVGRT